ncbi:unnamed protein product [Penicillium camemberti]|uniref:Str. FM013 n=1 Tax=Penicillium camemberti (strain FM 013) TaxID=1429867 RepID=A0A0G4PGZ2_PENC3|nr:unnamed protein product [Penicillium camemberti]
MYIVKVGIKRQEFCRATFEVFTYIMPETAAFPPVILGVQPPLARQFKPRVARAKAPKKVCQDRDTVHLGTGKRWTAILRFKLAVVISLCRISVKRIAKNKTVPLGP